jgi:hypothetical protein
MWKKFVLAQLLALSVLCSYVCEGGNVKNIWATFVLEPNKANYQICQKQIDDSLSGKYEPLKSPTYIQLMENKLIGKFLKLIESGNSYAADLCFQFYPLFYGHAELQEFFDIHLGKLIKKDPQLFLKLFKKYVYKNKKYISDADGLLLNYGDEFVDKFKKQIRETQERIEALKRVKGENYKEVRDYCIEILKKQPGFK